MSRGIPGRSRTRATLVVAAVALVVAGLALVRILVARAVPPAPAAHAPVAVSSASSLAAVEDEAPEIRGHVLDADGNAAPDATVRLVSPSRPYTVYRDARSDRSGRFAFPRVGPWRVRVVADHAPDGVVTSAVVQALEKQTVEITLVLSAAGAVRGTVTDAHGKPVAAAVISVEGIPWIVPPATSDEAGAFAFTTVPDEATSLVAVARGYRTARAAIQRTGDETAPIVHLVLSAADPVAGSVQDPDGNAIRARVVACEDQPAEARAESAEDGTFELPPSAIGCDAVAEHAAYGPSDAVKVVEGRRLAFRLKAGGAIEGVVVDERGAAVPAFTLGIESFVPTRGRTFEPVAARSLDDSRGAFRWDRLAPGSYVLTAASPGRPPARSGSIDVRGGAITRDVRILLPQGGALTGHVYDESHAPLAGVELRFDQLSSVVPSKATAQTDAAGLYRLDGAPTGPFTMLVRKDGFRTRLVSGLRVDPGTTRREDVTLAYIDGGARLELGGIGAVLADTGSGVVLRELYPGDPAARAGLRAGDRVLAIDGEPTEGMSVADVLQRLRGEPGTSVGVSALRPESGESVQLVIVRDRIVK